MRIQGNFSELSKSTNETELLSSWYKLLWNKGVRGHAFTSSSPLVEHLSMTKTMWAGVKCWLLFFSSFSSQKL